MKPKTPFRPNAPTGVLRGREAPTGFLPKLREQFAKLEREVEGVRLRMSTRIGEGEPAAAVGARAFSPEPATQAFALDVLQTGLGTTQVQYVVRDGVTYDIPVVFPPPGVFRARYLTVQIFQRVFDTATGRTLQFPVVTNDFIVDQIAARKQTTKFSIPQNGGGAFADGSAPARCNFLWNLIDGKSGHRLSDQFLPDTLLLPQPTSSHPYVVGGGNLAYGASGGSFEFDLPWLFERDANIVFQWRPINAIVQATAATGAVWYPASSGPTFDDREFGGAVRNNEVSVQVELHGTRHYNEQDAMRIGARSRDV